MPLNLALPIIYLITDGATTISTTTESCDFLKIVKLVEAAVAAEIPLFQIREKKLSARVLYELTARAAAITCASATKLIVNDRADVARAAGADGVQLTTRSLPADVVRRLYGKEFLIGVSTHSVAEAMAAQKSGADFVVFGPVFETESKRAFGEPLGLEGLRAVASELGEFPVVAIGGIGLGNVGDCFHAGAKGVAAIRMLSDAESLPGVAQTISRGIA